MHFTLSKFESHQAGCAGTTFHSSGGNWRANAEVAGHYGKANFRRLGPQAVVGSGVHNLFGLTNPLAFSSTRVSSKEAGQNALRSRRYGAGGL